MKEVNEMPRSGEFVAVLSEPSDKYISFLYRADQTTGFISIFHGIDGDWAELEDQETVEQTFNDLGARFFVA